jgi:hypothetical protein
VFDVGETAVRAAAAALPATRALVCSLSQ